MKTTLGGDRLGSGNKQEIAMRNYERSTHDLSYIWRSSMACGTLVPFMSELALPGDTWDLELNAHCLTLPTIGPLFGSYKVQLDVFQIPIRLYNGKLHMNKIGIGMDMSQIKFPIMELEMGALQSQNYQNANNQINTSCLLRYLGISGIGGLSEHPSNPDIYTRSFNGIPLLAYWDIFKQYYANKQEQEAYVIHTSPTTIQKQLTPIAATIYYSEASAGERGNKDIYNQSQSLNATNSYVTCILGITFPIGAPKPNYDSIIVSLSTDGNLPLTDLADDPVTDIWWSQEEPPAGGEFNRTRNTADYTVYVMLQDNSIAAQDWAYIPMAATASPDAEGTIQLSRFDLSEIDTMRELILSDVQNAAAFNIGEQNIEPYSYLFQKWGNEGNWTWSKEYSQEGLAVKTYQSDLFNNWINTEFIDGANGVNEISKVSTVGGEFTIDALNLASKVYVMLNRIAISGGTYDDWLDAVYTHERTKSVENPMYMGGLIKELTFEEVVSNSETEAQPLGTLAGRGRLTQKHKGGKIIVKVDEPSYIMGIVSLTPRVDYSQGNKWDMHLLTMDDLHKPAMDAIGFQDLITEQMCYSDTNLSGSNGSLTQHSMGKQPAWINYMTNVNRTYGNFADPNKEMFMTLNRRYETNLDDPGHKGAIIDRTTYIDPVKFNQIFADTNLDAQNFWMQISNNITCRRKMSAKVIPNL